MKQLKLLILLAAVLLGTSCSKIKFDEDGSPYVKGGGVSENTYLSEVCGYGWKLVSEKYIRDNGTVEKKNIWETGVSGYSPIHLYFEKDFFLKYYISSSSGYPSFSKSLSFFKDSGIYRPDAVSVDRCWLRIVSVDSYELILINRFAYKSSLCTYKRMTKSELEEYQKTYIHEEQ